MKYTRKQRAAALMLDVPTADVSEESGHAVGTVFVCGWSTAVLVLTDREADRVTRTIVQRDLAHWMTASDLAWMINVSFETAEEILELSEASQIVEMLLTPVGKLDTAISRVIRDAGGRGPFLAMYDGKECEITVGGVNYYGYRI